MVRQYRATRRDPYPPGCPGHWNPHVRQGYYINAESVAEVRDIMRKDFPDDREAFDVQDCEELDHAQVQAAEIKGVHAAPVKPDERTLAACELYEQISRAIALASIKPQLHTVAAWLRKEATDGRSDDKDRECCRIIAAALERVYELQNT